MADDLEFDELDPCCQREILNERKSKLTEEKLRRYDQSNFRLDVRYCVFTDEKGLKRCNCCPQSDYSSLDALKQMNLSGILHKVAESNKNEEEDDDDENDLDEFLLDFKPNYQSETHIRLLRYKLLETFGFGVHIEESSQHIQKLVSSKANLILHIFENTYIDAQLDLALEKLAKRYYGTIFRRISIAASFLLDVLSNWMSLSSDSSILNKITKISQINRFTEHSLICFVDGYIINWTSNFHEFGDEECMYESEISRYLSMLNVLSNDPNETVQTNLTNIMKESINKSTFTEKDQNEDDNTYCDDPSCHRKFPHQHVNKHNENAGVLGLTVTSKKTSSGEEIFSQNYLTRL